MAAINNEDNESTNDSDNDNAMTTTDHPSWLKNLFEYFEFCDVEKRQIKDGDKVRFRNYYTLNCNICKSIPDDKRKSGDQGKVQGNSNFAFKRHLERQHAGCYNKDTISQISKEGAIKRKHDSEQETIVTSIFGVTGTVNSSKQVKKYDPRGLKQQTFNKHALDFIALDGVPLSVTEGRGFRQLVNSIDNQLTCPSKSTISRLLVSKHEQLMKHLRTMLQQIKIGSAHLLLDIWSSKQKEAVIGVQVRFIHDWKLQQYTLGFRHFPGTHDGKRIKVALETMLKETYGLNMYDFLTVTADNASSILAAFKDLELFDRTTKPMTGNEEAEETEADESISLISSAKRSDSNSDDILDGFNEDNTEIVREFVTNDEIDRAIETVIDSWLQCDHSSVRKTRNSCLAHLLQLAIKDALNEPRVAALLKKVNALVNWFHKSNKFYTELRKLTELGLIKPCDTRWNSFFHCLKRLLRNVPVQKQSENQGKICDVANKIVTEAKKSLRKVPSPLNDDDISALMVIVQLLEPFASLTDTWQSDGVTSSSVIIGFIDAIKALDDVEVNPSTGDDDDELEDVGENDESFLKNFKTKLRTCVMQRFENEKSKGQKVQGRNIVTTNIFGDKFYILATILDPRCKTIPFEDDFIFGLTIHDYPTKEKAIDILKKAFKEESFDSAGLEVVAEITASQSSGHSPKPQDTSLEQNNEAAMLRSSQPAIKKKKSAFSRVQHHHKAKEAKEKVVDEIEDYLRSAPISESENPLRFWRLNHERLPVLSTMAAKYLALPATSASVERLFSIGGSIMRARRASMKIETAERLILYREYLRDGGQD